MLSLTLKLVCRKLSTSTFVATEGVQIKCRVKGRATGHSNRSFIDLKRVQLEAGKGGDGCIAFERAFCNPHAGPSGGDGGNGGHVIFQANSSTIDLSNVPSICQGLNGSRGSGSHCHGANAKPLIIQVPLDTQVHFLSESKELANGEKQTETAIVSARRFDKSTLLSVLKTDGELHVAARGGAGGRGNAFFAVSKNLRIGNLHEEGRDGQRLLRNGNLRLAERGGVGEKRHILLRLPNFADIGLVGAPNAGKSTLLRRLTRARPRVAPYPFTTLRANVGSLYLPFKNTNDENECLKSVITVADLPGLIEGAAELNAGLGAEFLSLIEGCSLLVYLVDIGSIAYAKKDKLLEANLETETESCTKQLAMLHRELNSFNSDLVSPTRSRLVLGTKLDLCLPTLASISDDPTALCRRNATLSRIQTCLNVAAQQAGIFKDASLCSTLLISSRFGENIDKLINLLSKFNIV